MTQPLTPFASPSFVSSSPDEAPRTPLPDGADIWTRWAEPALRLAMALLFLVVLGTLLKVLAPPPAGVPQRLALAALPALTDPMAVEPISAEAARQSNAALPVADQIDPAAPFLFPAASPGAQERARDCLAAAAWYEAGDDPSGERAVVQVVLNRARHPAYPASVCGVVFQGSERHTGCQFTFTCDGSLSARHPGPAAWARARAVAGAALAGAVDPRVGWATHYHADYVVPTWRNSLDKIAQLGAHLFYRWRGGWGTGAAFRSPSAGRASANGGEPVETALTSLSPAHGTALSPDDDALMASLTEADRTLATDSALLAYAIHPAAALAPGLSSGQDTPERTALIALHGPALSGKAVPHADSGDDTPIRLALDPALFPGRYALQALELCGHRPRCLVLGWRPAASGPVSTSGPTAGPLPAGTPAGASSGTLAFVYRRDRAGGGEGAWWDCTLTPRADKAQCLPPSPQRLLADWTTSGTAAAAPDKHL